MPGIFSFFGYVPYVRQMLEVALFSFVSTWYIASEVLIKTSFIEKKYDNHTKHRGCLTGLKISQNTIPADYCEEKTLFWLKSLFSFVRFETLNRTLIATPLLETWIHILIDDMRPWNSKPNLESGRPTVYGAGKLPHPSHIFCGFCIFRVHLVKL